MIVGYTPFYEDGMDQMTLFKAIVNQPVTYPQDCSAQCRDLLKRLLRRRPSHRIGSGGEDEIFQHGWFSQIDFHKLFRQEYKSPHVPNIKDPLDVANFASWNHLDDKTKIHYPNLSPKEKEYFKDF
jgi:serum/glucocorticoid-regulated kinase 2